MKAKEVLEMEDRLFDAFVGAFQSDCISDDERDMYYLTYLYVKELRHFLKNKEESK